MKHTDPFDTLLHRYRGLLFSLCRRYCRNGTTVDDLLQEASIALWRNHEQLTALPWGPQQAALTWKIARNAIIDDLRRTPVTETLPDDYDTVDDDRRPLEELRERIAMLDEPDRTIVTLQLEGYSYEEIGQKLGLTEKNVSVRLVRTKEKLRKEMTI